MKSLSNMLSFLVVTYNSEKFLAGCLDSVYDKVKGEEFEIIIKDNDSKDSTSKIAEEYSRKHGNIRFIASKLNNGFAAGNNDAAEAASGGLLFILSPDAVIAKYDHDKVKSLLDSDKYISTIQPKIRKMLYPDIVESCGHHIDTLGNAYVENADLPNRSFPTKRIFAPTGATFIIKKDVFLTLGGFDADYFILYEETDLCWRNNLLGYKSYYLDDIEVFHFGSGSMNQGVERGVRINYRMTYFYLRNKISSGIKNFSEPDLLFKFILGNTFLYIASSFFWLLKLDWNYFKVIWKALFFNLFHIGRLLKKRGFNRSMVKVSNRELIRQGLITGFSFSAWLKKVRG